MEVWLAYRPHNIPHKFPPHSFLSPFLPNFPLSRLSRNEKFPSWEEWRHPSSFSLAQWISVECGLSFHRHLSLLSPSSFLSPSFLHLLCFPSLHLFFSLFFLHCLSLLFFLLHPFAASFSTHTKEILIVYSFFSSSIFFHNDIVSLLRMLLLSLFLLVFVLIFAHFSHIPLSCLSHSCMHKGEFLTPVYLIVVRENREKRVESIEEGDLNHLIYIILSVIQPSLTWSIFCQSELTRAIWGERKCIIDSKCSKLKSWYFMILISIEGWNFLDDHHFKLNKSAKIDLILR